MRRPDLLLSVVICTHNRAEFLDSLLETMRQQTLDPGKYEILIVDNASTDDTAAIVQKHSRLLPNLRSFYEPNIGLSHARNRGWQEALGIFIGYTDDDCRVPPEWLSVAAEIANHGTCVAFCGPYYAWFNSPKPRWFKEEYGHVVLGDTARALENNEYPQGPNMFVRKDLLEKLKGFDPALGMTGSQLAYGEETLLFKQLREQFPAAVISYDPRLYVYHVVRKEKMSFIGSAHRAFLIGRATFHILQKPVLGSWWSRFRRFLYLTREFTADMIRGALQRDRQQYPFLRNYLYECGLQRIVQLGINYEVLRQRKR